MNYRTGNQGFLRQQNLRGIVHHLYENAPISRVDLAKLTGLNKTTVSSLVEELLENKFIRELGADQSTNVGRRSILLDLNPTRGYIVSGEIGANFVDVICTDFKFKILWRHKEPLVKDNQDESLKISFDVLQKAFDFAKEQGNLLGIAVGVHGLLDKNTGTLLFAPTSGWREVSLLEKLKQSFETEIFVDNEANLAALGEQYLGVAQGNSEVLYISIGRGLGGGIVINGQPYNGSTGIAGEFGHLTLFPDGLLCQCGNRGCWETEVSQAALNRQIENSIKNGQTTSLIQKLSTKSQLSVINIVEAAQKGDTTALNALDAVGCNLGIGIASLLNVFNPSLIVLGGELSIAAEYLLPAVHKELKNRSLRWSRENAQIVVARFGSDAAIMGGVASVFQAKLANLRV